jgi:hypothetical protein
MEADYVLENAVCLPTSIYKWGFSFLVLFSFCMATLCFLLALQALAWSLYAHSRADRLEQHISVHRDVLDIAEELVASYGAHIADLGSKNLDK